MEADIIAQSDNYKLNDIEVARFDLRSFFMSINLEVLWDLLKAFIIANYKGDDIDTLLYLTEIIVFHRPQTNCRKKGDITLWDELPAHKSLFSLPFDIGMAIGNLTSQQFANFYMSFFDEFMIWLCKRYGCRYERFVDDFAVVGNRNIILRVIRPLAEKYLRKRLKVSLHHDKFYLQPVQHGVKFVGTMIMPGRKYISNRTVGGMYDKLHYTDMVCKAIVNGNRNCRNLLMLRHCISALNSYLGFMVHVSAHKLRRKILDSASEDFWKCCFVVGDYTTIKILKHYKVTTYLKEKEDEEFSAIFRDRTAVSRGGRKKARKKAVHNKL